MMRRPRLLILVALFALISGCVSATDPGTTASGIPDVWAFPADRTIPTYGTGGMVASTDPVASAIGVEILRRGGNAVDAAVAVQFALAVVNPEAGNIGGGGFMVLRMGEETAALDFREKAPLAATRDMYLTPDGQATDGSRVGHRAAGVPGSVAGMWEAHQRYGSLPWGELIEPAENLADGIVVHERLADSLARFENVLRRYPSTAATFLPGGSPPRVADRFAQPDLAATLRRIADQGTDGFYGGETAGLIVAEMERGGGIVTAEDLRRYRAIWREPIVFTYRDHTVVSMPPPSSGGVALAEILNILEGYDLAQSGFLSAEHVHLWTEASKRAFADRNAYLGDPDFVSQPVETLISDAYAEQRRAEIDSSRAIPSERVSPGLGAPSEGSNTTHYSIVDADGNAVAVTTTINSLYGSGVTVPGAGFILNNEMDDFATSPGRSNQYGLVQGEVNAIEPEKRMLSSMSPTIVLDPAGRVRLITGSPGGPTIISSVAEVISDVLDFGMDLGEAASAPRVHHQHLPDVLYYERDGLLPVVQTRLEEMGHTLEARTGYQGDTQSILVLADGTLAGVADPRQGGAAVSVRQTRDVVQ